MNDDNGQRGAGGRGHYKKMAITAAGTLGSRVLGLVRDQLTTYFLGAGAVASALVLAQTIPNLFRRLLGEGALTAALVPVMTGELKAGGRARAFRLLNRLLWLAAPAMAALTLVLMLAAWLFARWAGAGIAAAGGVAGGAVAGHAGLLGLKAWHPLAAELTVWCMPYMPLVCLAAVFTAALNIFGRFGVSSLGPLMLNACVITALCAGGFYFAKDNLELLALWACGGLVVGGVVQLLSPVAALWLREGWRLRREAKAARVDGVAAAVGRGGTGESARVCAAKTMDSTNTGTDTIVCATQGEDPLLRLRAVFLPALAGAGVQQLNLAVSRFLALGVDERSLSLYYYAGRIVELPVGLFAITVATVIFPAMTACAARGEHGRMGVEFAHGMRLILAINIPAAAGLVALCAPVVRLLFEQGRFGPEDTAATLPLLCVFAAAMPFYGAIALMGRALNAVQITKPQARLAVVVFLVNLVLSPVLAWVAGAPGLAAANLAGAVLQTVVLLRMLRRHSADFLREPLLRPLLQCLAASAATGAAAWAAWTFAATPATRWLSGLFSKLALPGGPAGLPATKAAEALPLLAVILGAAVLYFALLALMGYPEIQRLRHRVRRH